MADSHTTFDNPFAAPAAETVSVVPWKDRTSAITLRREHLRHESALRFVGSLYLVLGGICLISAPAIFERSGWLMSALVAVAVGMVFLGLGQAIRMRWRKVVPFATVFASIGLIVPYAMLIANAAVSSLEIPYLPIEALLNGPLLYLIHSRRGRFIFSDSYAEILEQTTDIPVTMSLSQKVILAFLCLSAFLFAFVLARLPIERLLS